MPSTIVWLWWLLTPHSPISVWTEKVLRKMRRTWRSCSKVSGTRWWNTETSQERSVQEQIKESIVMSVSTSDCSPSIPGDWRRHHGFLKTPQTPTHRQRGGGDHVSWETGSCSRGQQSERDFCGWWFPPGQHLQTFGPKELYSAAQQTKDHHHPGLQRRWCSSQLTSTRLRCFYLEKQTACISGGGGGVVLADDLDPAEKYTMSDTATTEDQAIWVVHKEKDFISLLCCTPGVFKDTTTHGRNS